MWMGAMIACPGELKKLPPAYPLGWRSMNSLALAAETWVLLSEGTSTRHQRPERLWCGSSMRYVSHTKPQRRQVDKETSAPRGSSPHSTVS